MTAPWVELTAVPTPLPELPGTEEEVEAEWAAIIAQASEVLWALSGRRWAGESERTVEVVAPVIGCEAPPGYDLSWGTVAHPHMVEGEIVNHRCCPTPPEVRLPGQPTAVDSVTIDGVDRDPATYRLAGNYLQDLSGRGWPTCEPGMTVVYTNGRTPPAGGQRAAALLARELARARLGDPACGLPANVTSVTRQGITQTFVPASQIIALGQTGLVAVDTWLATVNPGRLTRRARAWSPDTHPRSVRRITP